MLWLVRFVTVVLLLVGHGSFPRARADLGESSADAGRQAPDSINAPRASTRQGEAQRSEQAGGWGLPHHLGTPKELIDESGRVSWSAAHGAWNQIQEQWFDDAAPRGRRVASPFRGLGQYIILRLV